MFPILNNTGRVFEIYSIGDGLYMQRILNSVAAMSNTGLLVQLVALSLILGLLVMGVKNVMAGGNKLDLGTIFISFIMGIFMFGMTANVAVYDMSYSPGDRVQGDFTVNNVPFGIAAAGWIISGVGYNLTEQMEQGFSIPGMETMKMYQGGFGKTLEWISAVKMWEVPTDALPNGAGRELELWKRNLTSYITECTIPAIEMDHISLSRVRNAEDPLTMHATGGGIGYDSVYLMTEFYTGSTKTSLTCQEGFNTLVSMRSSGYQGFVSALAFKMLENGGPQGTQATLNDSFRSIGYSQDEVMKLMMSASVGTSLQFALENGEVQTSLSNMNKIMIEQATAQRAVQWAAEETMFRRIMRPMMAFFESLLYALAPFMALAIGLGAFGIQTVFRYMMLAVWVALWMPMLSIIQLYQITAMQNAVAGMLNGMDGTGMSKTSIAGAELIRSQAMEWLASGAALAAWTPAITMALVWSGSVTASALAGKLQGSDTINEKLSAPDTTNSPSALSSSSVGGFDSVQGYMRSGGQGQLDAISFKTSNSSSLSSERAQATEAAHSYGAAYGRSAQHSFRTGQNWEQFRSQVESGTVQFSRDGKVLQTPNDFVAAWEQSGAISSSRANQMRSSLAANASGQAGATTGGGGGGSALAGLAAALKGGVSGTVSSEAANTTESAFRDISSLNRKAGLSVQMSDGWTNQLVNQAQSGAKVARTGAEENVANSDKSVREAWDKVERASDSFRSARSTSREIGTVSTRTADQITGLIGRGSDASQGGRGAAGSQDAQYADNAVGAINASASRFLDGLSDSQKANATQAMNGDIAIARSLGKRPEEAQLYANAKFLAGGFDTAIGGNIVGSSNDRAAALESSLTGNEVAGAHYGGAPRAANANEGVVPENLREQVGRKQAGIRAEVSSESSATAAGARATPGVQSVGDLLGSASDPHSQANARYDQIDGEIKAENLRKTADQMELKSNQNPNGNNVAEWYSDTFGDDSTSSRGALLRFGEDGQVYMAKPQGYSASPGVPETLSPVGDANTKNTSSDFNRIRDYLMSDEGPGYEAGQASFVAAAQTGAKWGTNDWFAAAEQFNKADADTRQDWVKSASEYKGGRDQIVVDTLRHEADVAERDLGAGPRPAAYDLRGGDGEKEK